MSRGEAGHSDFWQQLNSNSEVSHAYETLMSSLEVLSAARPLSSVMITSAQPEEGKTTVTVNLGLTMMRAGKNVLILDADLRRPQIHRVLQVENSRGLADVLAGSAGVHDVIRVVRVGDEGPRSSHTLSVITSGRVDGSIGGLGSAKAKVKEAIEYVTKLYDLILLDSPPTLAVSDALLLGRMVDGVLLVLNTGTVTERDARRAKERLEESGAHIVGVVMNRFDEKLHGPGFHPYRSYYTRETK